MHLVCQYGPESMQSLINKSFENKREALLWLFLGAHSWLHQDHVERDSKAFQRVLSCCQFVDYGKEREYIFEFAISAEFDEYQGAEATPIELTMSEKCADKLMRTELTLYRHLKGEEAAVSPLD